MKNIKYCFKNPNIVYKYSMDYDRTKFDYVEVSLKNIMFHTTIIHPM